MKSDPISADTLRAFREEIYGHFTEHIGGVVYDGIWVGEESKVANIGGIRQALVEHMRRLKPPVVRWPGGCFADSYNWRDGVGPRAQRPRRTNFWIVDDGLRKAPDGPQKYDPNSFGTNEFARFCRPAVIFEEQGQDFIHNKRAAVAVYLNHVLAGI